MTLEEQIKIAHKRTVQTWKNLQLAAGNFASKPDSNLLQINDMHNLREAATFYVRAFDNERALIQEFNKEQENA